GRGPGPGPSATSSPARRGGGTLRRGLCRRRLEVYDPGSRRYRAVRPVRDRMPPGPDGHRGTPAGAPRDARTHRVADRRSRGPVAGSRVVMTAWFFLVWALGAHNGHSYTARVVVDRIVMPTLELCEAARRGVEEELAAEPGPLYIPGPRRP